MQAPNDDGNSATGQVFRFLDLAVKPRSEFLHRLLVKTVADLPVLQKTDVDLSDACPVCTTSFGELFDEEAEYLKKVEAGGLQPEGKGKKEAEAYFGVTKVEYCGHTFCRSDIAQWVIGEAKGTCPFCRHLIVEIPSETDDESSDGGEYIPEGDDFEEELTDVYSDFDLAPSDPDGLYDGLTEDEARGRLAELRDQYAAELQELREVAQEEMEREALRAEFSSQMADDDEAEEEQMREELRQEFAIELQEMDAVEDREREFEDAFPELEEERREQALMEQYREELGGLEDLDYHKGYEDDSIGSDTLMDVYLSDSSSDLDYEPQDYLMSDSDSDSMSSDFDYSIEELGKYPNLAMSPRNADVFDF
ncbi:hypothetical protein D9611_007717 [Ephemerocybe angulata]|uniref:RING-type domain-containing protein n=1 Tax=Ephemerocybe angulata TaxID=980116 RepID=A0A8H5FCF2_9AGAR|nr:hypothetical protein D9611_007717 [Tulosesus angulatus]